MRFSISIFTALAALVAAQTSSSQQNAINIQGSTLNLMVGQNTITWSNPSSGTVTIKLQQGSSITPDSGLVVASNIPASAETATFTITAGEVNTADYVLEIIDEQNPNNYNFSPNFAISGATGTATGFPSATASASSVLSSAVSSALSSASSVSSASVSSASSASRSASSASSSASASSSHSSSSASASSSSASASATSAPHSGAGNLKVQGGLVALIAGAVAMF